MIYFVPCIDSDGFAFGWFSKPEAKLVKTLHGYYFMPFISKLPRLIMSWFGSQTGGNRGL